MSRFLGALVATGLTLVVAGAVRAEDAEQAGVIIDKAIKAEGGEEALGKYKAATWKMKGTFHGMGVPIAFTGERSVQWPDKMRSAVEANFNDTKFNITTVFNKDKGWMKTNDMSQELEGDQAGEQKDELYASYVAQVAPLKDKSYTLTSLGESKVDNKPAVGVKVASKGHKDISLYFDKDSGLLVKMERQAKTQTGEEVKQETLFSDYKEVQGVKHPMKVVIKRDGNAYLDTDISDLKLVDQLDDKLFKEP
jgi:outer membrane lipoprotein-sorting protein